MATKVTLRLTPAQIRMVNSALSYFEADVHDAFDDYRPDVMERTREAVHKAMAAAKVSHRW